MTDWPTEPCDEPNLVVRIVHRDAEGVEHVSEHGIDSHRFMWSRDDGGRWRLDFTFLKEAMAMAHDTEQPEPLDTPPDGAK